MFSETSGKHLSALFLNIMLALSKEQLYHHKNYETNFHSDYLSKLKII